VQSIGEAKRLSVVMSTCELVSFSVGNGNVTCVTTPSLATNNSFVDFFNACHRDPVLSVGPFGYVGNELRAWFTAHNLLLAVTLAIVLLPFMQLPARLNGPASDALSRLHFSRFHAAQLLYRIAFAFSLSAWLQVVVQQPSPCVCTEALSTNGVDPAPATEPLLAHNGMPDGNTAALVVVAGFLVENVSIPLGIVLALLFGAAQVLTGLYSVGQVLTGVAIGALLHLLQTRTPGVVRVIEFSLSLTGTIVAFVLVKRYNGAKSDISPGSVALAGALWQLTALLMPLIWFDWTLVKETLRKAPATLHPVDFLYYVPLLSSSSAATLRGRSNINLNLTEPEPDLGDGTVLLRRERRLLQTTVLLGVLMLLLSGVRMIEPKLNNWFEV
jgi:hypothetical protein